MPFTSIQYDDETIVGMDLSPDLGKLAYLEKIKDATGAPIKEILRIVDGHGKLLLTTTFDRTDLRLARWVNNQILQLHPNNSPQGDGTLILFNPYTGERNTIADKLPDLNLDDSIRPIWRIDYGPDLQWLVYEATKQGNGVGPIVWDTVAKKVLWKSPYGGFDIIRPKWSPQSDRVALITNDRLYIIDHSGQSQLIFNDSENYVANPAWSPDGHYLAFQTVKKSLQSGSLLVYDVEANQIIDPCITTSITADDDPSALFWAPDSHQIAVSFSRETQATQVALTMLVDLQKNISYEMPLFMFSTWMKATP